MGGHVCFVGGGVCLLTWVPVVDSLTHIQIHQDRTGLCPPPTLLILLPLRGYCIMHKVSYILEVHICTSV